MESSNLNYIEITEEIEEKDESEDEIIELKIKEENKNLYKKNNKRGVKASFYLFKTKNY